MANQEDEFGMFSQQRIISDNPNNDNLMNFEDDQNNAFNAEMIEKPTNSESFSMVQETAEEPIVKSSRRSSESSSKSSEASSIASPKVFRGLFKRSITGKCNIFKSKEFN